MGLKYVIDESSGFQDNTVTTVSDRPIGEDGVFYLLYDYATMGDDGMLFDFSVRFNTYVDTDMLAASLEDLEAGEITIVNEVYPYTYSNFGDSNDYINIFSITYNVEINEPTLTVIDECVPGFNQGSNY
jgi:hypothetical protein